MEASVYESSVGDASGYTSQSTLQPGEENKDDNKNNRWFAVAICLSLLVALVVILLFTRSSSSSAAQVAGKDSGDDATDKAPSYVVRKVEGTSTTTTSITTEKKSKATKSTTKRSTTKRSTTKRSTTNRKTMKAATTITKTTIKRKTASTTTRKTTTPVKKTLTPTPSTTTTTTQRPIPHHTLVCTYGPAITKTSAFPKDGICDYTVLEEMPSSRAQDFGPPYPPGVQHFVDTAEKHRKTEFVAAFDYKLRSKTDAASKDPAVREHLHTLFKKRIFHYGYINTDTYTFSKKEMDLLLHILKRLVGYLEDKKTPKRPIYTFMSSAWSRYFDEVSARDVAAAFRTILMPDMFISKAHLYENDANYRSCRILPANLVREPDNLKNKNVYFYTLFSAMKHVSDLDKLRNEGIKTAALSVSVGVYGSFYRVATDHSGNLRNYTPGDACFPKPMKNQMATIAKVCGDGHFKDTRKSEVMSCEYFADIKGAMTFVFDTPTTIRNKLCLSKRNVTGVNFGITVARLEYSDATGRCGLGEFPMLTTVIKTLNFFKTKYKSPDAYEECLKSSRSSEEAPMKKGR